MKRILAIAMLCFAALVPTLGATPSQKPASILPDAFAGWQKSAADSSADPAVADKVNPNLLKEYGFRAFEDASFRKGERKIQIKAIRFGDASGAYGAFTFYKTPEMQTEKIGDQASSANERVLFYRGNVLVQTVLDRVTPMS